jgi:hypothetical protein
MNALSIDDFRVVKEFYFNSFVFFIEIRHYGIFTGKPKWRRIPTYGECDWHVFKHEDAKKEIKRFIKDNMKIKSGKTILPVE